jgi:tRNA pseudouridine55 synthase
MSESKVDFVPAPGSRLDVENGLLDERFSPSGYIAINKPAGMTSADVVHRVKRTLRAEKVGHAGTLDPDATGLLVCVINGATRLASFAGGGSKVYSGVIQFGVTTSSDDMSGEVIQRVDSLPTLDAIQSEVHRFIGEIDQVPPRVSAIRIAGRRAYDLERKGADFELASRKVTVFRFEVAPEDSAAPYHSRVRYEVECSAGTYIRSLARDLGAVLGCGGAIAELRRESCAGISVSNAIPLEEVSWKALKDWAPLLADVPRIVVPPALADQLLGGKQSALRAVEEYAPGPVEQPGPPSRVIFAAEGISGSLGILQWNDGRWGFYLNIAAQQALKFVR